MFTKLVASDTKKRRSWTPGAITVSIFVHALLLTGAVYASIVSPMVEEQEEEVTFLEVEEAPEPPAPEPPPPSPVTALPSPPQGFQELIPPIVTPPIIPDLDLSQLEVDPADFSGIGIAGGTATGAEGGVPQNSAAADSMFAFDVGVLETMPSLANRSQVQSVMARLYPRILLNAEIEGTVTVQFVIQPDGSVDKATIRVIDTTHEQFASASMKAIEEFRFRPGKYRGENVRVLIQMPIQWQVGS